MINESQPAGLNVSSYTVEEVETITSEYIMKNAVSMEPRLQCVLKICSRTGILRHASFLQGKSW